MSEHIPEGHVPVGPMFETYAEGQDPLLGKSVTDLTQQEAEPAHQPDESQEERQPSQIQPSELIQGSTPRKPTPAQLAEIQEEAHRGLDRVEKMFGNEEGEQNNE